MKLQRKPRTLGLALASSLLCLGTSSGVVTAGAGGGAVLSADVSAAGFTIVDLGPMVESDATSGGLLTDSASLFILNTSVALAAFVAQNGTDNALESMGSTDVTGIGLIGNSQGSATINNLGITLIPGLLAPDLLKLTSKTIGSTSTSIGQFGSLSSIGTTSLKDVTISLLGTNILLASNPAPNTVVDLIAAGVTDAGLLASLNDSIERADSHRQREHCDGSHHQRDPHSTERSEPRRSVRTR